MTWRWREDERGNAEVWAHWQNLNEDRQGNVKGLPWSGRAWLHVKSECFHIDWNLRSYTCGVSFSTERSGDDTVSGMIAFPPVAVYVGAELKKERLVRRLADWISKKSVDMFGKKDSGYSGSNFSVRVHDWALWWQFFTDDRGWTSKRPRWRDGNWHPLDTFLGKQQYASCEVEVAEVLVPLPEASYKAKVAMKSDSWTRPRWFPKVITRAHVDMIDPIPIPGKGENSYDCGQDAIYGSTFMADTTEEAVGKIVGDVLRTRKRHGGRNWVPEEKGL